MEDLVLKIKFSLKAKHKIPDPSKPATKTDSIQIFDKIIKVEDVGIITLNTDTQKILKCTVGDEITYGKPWVKINKNKIPENLESVEIPDTYEPFIPFKNYIINYPGDELLLVYAVDELREYDEFYLCLTLKEHDHVMGEIEKIKKEQNFRINNSVNKRVCAWKSLGSETEVNANIPKTSRGLYTVELHTKYPTKIKTNLRLESAESKKFNYTDLTVSEKYKRAIVQKKRTDAEVQTKPSCTSKEAQTTYNYPRNVWTQYEYNYAPVNDVDDSLIEGLEKRHSILGEEMLVNSNVNFYTDDYVFLNEKQSSGPSDLGSRKEYMSVIDIKSTGKMVTAFVWHPLLSGTIAAAYGCKSPLVNVKCKADNIIADLVYEEFWVLIWNINDTFHPKLMLECNSEVQCLSFCPHSENTLIGGCVNGQVLYWNLNDKLVLETERKISLKQKGYRNKIYAIMQWSEQIANIPIIPPSGKSEMVKSHRGNVTSLNWIHPCYSITEEGKCEFGDFTLHNQQFFTSGSDGLLFFWDLKRISYPQEDTPIRKLQKNKTRILHPTFTRRLIIPEYKFPCPLRWITQPKLDVRFEETILNSNNCFEVIKRKPTVLTTQQPILSQELIVGTYLGDFVIGSWAQEEVDDDGFETPIIDNDIKVLKVSRYHDGPVNTIEQHPQLADTYLTVGGKVVAIWKTSNPSKPIFWRKSKCNYTHGHWSTYQPSGFRLNRADGNREIWDLSVKSNEYHYQIEYGKSLLQASVHNFNIKNNLLTLADEQGSLRLVYIPDDIINAPNNTLQMKQILDNNEEVKNITSTWQTQWIAKYASHLIDEENRLKLERAHLEKQAHKERLRMKEKLAREAELQAKLEELKKRPPPGKRAEWAHEKWIEKEHQTLSNIMMKKKKLDRNTLKEQRKPVQIARNEKIKLSIKKREILTKSESIFKKTIAALFPVVADDSCRKTDLTDADKDDLRKQYITAYEQRRFECETFIHEHPYLSKINWNEALKNLDMKKRDLECVMIKGRRFKFKREHDLK